MSKYRLTSGIKKIFQEYNAELSCLAAEPQARYWRDDCWGFAMCNHRDNSQICCSIMLYRSAVLPFADHSLKSGLILPGKDVLAHLIDSESVNDTGQ